MLFLSKQNNLFAGRIVGGKKSNKNKNRRLKWVDLCFPYVPFPALPPPSPPPSLSVLLFMPVAKNCNLKTALAFPEPGGMCIRTWIFPQENCPCLLLLLRQKQWEQSDEPIHLCSSYSNLFERLRRGGGDGLCFTLSGCCLMRFVLHLFGWFSWFLCCSWKGFESHNSVSLSSSAISAQCLNGTHTTRKENGKFLAS